MGKYITDERTGLKYELVGDYYLIAGDDEPEELPYRDMGTASPATSEAAPQDHLHRADDKWKAERLSCRFERAGRRYVPSTG